MKKWLKGQLVAWKGKCVAALICSSVLAASGFVLNKARVVQGEINVASQEVCKDLDSVLKAIERDLVIRKEVELAEKRALFILQKAQESESRASANILRTEALLNDYEK